MWQVFLYLANERQVRERQEIRATHRGRRWSFGRRTHAPSTILPIHHAARDSDRETAQLH